MTRWSRGEAEIEQMLADGELQRVTEAGADGSLWVARATSTLRAAQQVIDTDSNAAYTLAYDAARFACAALLAHQGLRGTTAGGHYAVQRAVIRQFGSGWRSGSCADDATSSNTRNSRMRLSSGTRPTWPSSTQARSLRQPKSCLTTSGSSDRERSEEGRRGSHKRMIYFIHA